MSAHALEFVDVSKRFGKRRNVLWALNGVSFTIGESETLGVVGESGSGKSTIARIAVGLERPTMGTVTVQGQSLRQARSMHLSQMVFQDPASSFNPHLRVADSLREPLDASETMPKSERAARVGQLLREVGLSAEFDRRRPTALSGGQKQRASIGRALATLPPLLVCDEPVTALDVSIRAQLLNLFRRLQDEHGLSYLYISHDLSTVTYMCHRVMVLYLGTVMEVASTEQMYEEPAHPYTLALMSAIPEMQQGARRRRRIRIAGDPPSAINPPSGCRFHTRCPLADDRCRVEVPQLQELSPGHQVACHYAPVSEVALAEKTARMDLAASRTEVVPS